MKINGNLVFNTDATGEIQNAYFERLASAPTFNAAEKGRVYFNTTTSLFYYNDGASWTPLATGGNAAALQQEVDNIEAALGAALNGSGTFNALAFDGAANISSPTSVTDAILQLDSALNSNNTLAELDDVTITAAASGDFLRHNGTAWVDHVLVLGDVTDVTASAAEVNILDGATLSTTELNYVTGVTSSIQDQLDSKQTEDATLTALSALAGTGFVVQTDVDTFTHRTLVGPEAGITIINANGVTGNATLALANDLAALEGLATTGIIVRTGDGTAVTREITGTDGNIVVTDGDGVASEPTIDLATVSQAASGNFVKVTLDGYGRVTGNTPVVTADVTALVDATYVNVSGDTMAGNLVIPTGYRVTITDAPVNDTDAVNKAYADALAAGLSWKQAVHVLADTDVDIASAPASIDGHTLNVGERVLLTGQTDPYQDGIYVFNGAATAMTRSTDADAFAELNGAAVFVQHGTVYADSGWTQTSSLTSLTTGNTQTWNQFSGANAYTWGDGLTVSGNTVDINMGAGIAMLPSDEVGIDLYDEPNGALILTLDGSAHSTDTGSKLYLKLDSAGALAQTSAGLKINAASVTNAMLANPSFSLTADTGSDTLPLGDGLHVTGVSTQGVSVAVTEAPAGTSQFEITVANASSSQKGVASFTTGEFVVTDGVVELGTIPHEALDAFHINFVGTDASSSSVDLGGSLTFADGGSHTTAGNLVRVITEDTGDTVTIAIREATASLKGVASFSSADFIVTAGVVTAVERSLSDLTDISLTAETTGDMLVYDGTDFVNRKTYFLYDGASATSHTVTHNLGQKYCNVTVVDASDEVVIPQSITFVNDTQLTVTFTSAIACKVVVMGVTNFGV